jgi:probable HAF family extracellular repeat protein
LDVPGALRTIAMALNQRGDTVGPFVGADGRTHGFVWSNGTYAVIDVPGAVFTQANGINARGDIVGFYTNADRVAHGFLLSGGTFTTVDVPGVIQLRGISATGIIVGAYSSVGVTHGFLLQQ